ncbi:MAG: efflux RND transporter periplasmic adaptor subunit [Vicinamibacterales bacterium]
MLRLLRNPRVLLSLAVVAGLLAVALWPTTTVVETATVGRGPLVVTVDEEGETRVRNRFVVSAPLSGRVLRIELEPGDPVKRGDVVARVRPEAAPLLDARTSAEARAAVETARASLGRARAEEQRLRALLAQAQRELMRARELIEGGLATGQQLDTRQAEVRSAEEAVQAAAFAVGAAEAELRRAQARVSPAPSEAGGVVTVTAPIDGVVLRRLRESESIVPAGEPLLEIGNPAELEIVSDLLSTDAVKVKEGARALVEQWGGDRTLEARVRRVEPAGFTKVSALGVEEQRVNVVLDFLDPADAFAALGDAYRVEVRVVVWESADVLKIPTSALFRQGEAWAAYAVIDGRAVARTLMLGQRTGQEAEVREGLSAGDVVIVHPGDTLADGARVDIRRPEAARE